jgi:hypothetical protein
MAVSLIISKLQEECDGNMFAENYNKYHCTNYYHGIRNFAHCAIQTNVFPDLRNLIKFWQEINHMGAFTSALCDLIESYKYCKNDTDQVRNDADPIKTDQPINGAI